MEGRLVITDFDEEALKATMNEKIRKAMEEVVSSRLQSLSQPATNISPGSA
jgi:hypothetical protein